MSTPAVTVHPDATLAQAADTSVTPRSYRSPHVLYPPSKVSWTSRPQLTGRDTA